MRRIMCEQAAGNRHINEAWLAAMARVPFAGLEQERGAFFGSIFATWNHILLGDRIWLGRIAGQPIRVASLADQICGDFATLETERARTDQDLVERVETETDFVRVIDYHNNAGEPDRQPLYRILLHLFAHQQHHRGQISQMCHEMGLEIPDGGLIGFYRSGGG